MNRRTQQAWQLAQTAMTPPQFEAWVRHTINEEPITQIAASLTISRQAVQARLRNANKNLNKARHQQKAA